MTSPRTTMTGLVHLPAPANEPARDFAPGSDDALRLRKELDRVAGDIRTLTHVVGGRRPEATETTDVVAPHDHGHVLARIPTATDAIVDEAIDAALTARAGWSTTPWFERAAVLLRAAELAAGRYRDELLATTMLCQSKTYHQAEIDINELVDFFRYNAHLAEEIYAVQPPVSPAGQVNYVDHKGLEGFVLAVTPFNFTAIAGNLPAAPALMGNVVVWKPSEKSALSSDVVMRVFEEAGFPPGVINLVHGSGEHVTERVTAHRDFAGLSFTGSTSVFRRIWKRVGDNIENYRSYPRIVGETGGKNAIVVHPSADVDAVHSALVRGAFEYQGQKCSAASRAYIPRSIWDTMESKLADTVGSLPVGDIVEHGTFVGAVIDETAQQRLQNAFDRVVGTPGHRILVGGTTDREVGWFVDPTVVVTEDPSSFVMEEEFFGPLLAVHVYDDDRWEQTLDLVDGTSDYALTCSIFATDRAAIVTALDTLREAAGMTYVNDKPTGASIGQQQFGGGRGSGTNDKTGSALALQRWVNARFVKENFAPATTWTYPYMGV
ncbi:MULTISPECIES: L-glutamate gamma-semialdehyde dehydrogenase [unclassified Rhodococcus (in: high G+C Gram-positive bacteria)]|uniref:L-glutamate gamma-semialdehyde dehydrogenase n=1 Tax=unclassified Rhodococcus (in: high G+C Gram-positive bacteria) TaxID=192944 RepID=UPI0021C09A4F|nr:MULTISPECIES: L-glutamate gamma-semialdehyde dehydrogenase [unclassified Rhodococcus (in: high G+C Gram-positive bacteria)]